MVGNRLFVWKGVKTSNILRQSAVTAAQKLNERYCYVAVVQFSSVPSVGYQTYKLYMLLKVKSRLSSGHF